MSTLQHLLPNENPEEILQNDEGSALGDHRYAVKESIHELQIRAFCINQPEKRLRVNRSQQRRVTTGIPVGKLVQLA
jgi:hypothetical protein